MNWPPVDTLALWLLVELVAGCLFELAVYFVNRQWHEHWLLALEVMFGTVLTLAISLLVLPPSCVVLAAIGFAGSGTPMIAGAAVLSGQERRREAHRVADLEAENAELRKRVSDGADVR